MCVWGRGWGGGGGLGGWVCGWGDLMGGWVGVCVCAFVGLLAFVQHVRVDLQDDSKVIVAHV